MQQNQTAMANQLFRPESIPNILREAEAGLHDGRGVGLKKYWVGDQLLWYCCCYRRWYLQRNRNNRIQWVVPCDLSLHLYGLSPAGSLLLRYAEFASTVPASGKCLYLFLRCLRQWNLPDHRVGTCWWNGNAIGNIAVASFHGVIILPGSWIQPGCIYPTGWRWIIWFAKAGASAEAISAWANAPNLFGLRLIMMFRRTDRYPDYLRCFCRD